MPRERTSMRKIKEILRLSLKEGMGHREIAQSTKVGKTTIQELLANMKAKNVTWETIHNMPEHWIVEKFLYPKPETIPFSAKPVADWAKVRMELLQKGVTLSLLWMDYKAENPNGFQYSRFCELYRRWEKESRLVLRHYHVAGEKMFVDFSGLTVPWIDPKTNEIQYSEIFVAVLGASNYTFAKACVDQTLNNWIYAHIDTFNFFCGVPKVVVPDNLRSGVTKACRYDPEVNPTYLSMAEHYDTVIVPTRSYKPRDKAKVEVAVQIVQRWILVILRRQTFTSVAEINDAIKPLLEKLNTKIMRHLNVSRQHLWEKFEKPILKQLPEAIFEISSWKTARVNIDYHIEFARHYYSVPFRFVGAEVRVKATRSLIEVFHTGELIAQHKREENKFYRHSTLECHMPPKHAEYVKWTPEKILNWAQDSGDATRMFCENIIATKKHAEQGFRACLGVLRLGKIYDSIRLENACALANEMRSHRYRTVQEILKQGKDKIKTKEDVPNFIPIPSHENIRGSTYYK